MLCLDELSQYSWDQLMGIALSVILCLLGILVILEKNKNKREGISVDSEETAREKDRLEKWW